ncbi:MAG: trypsin-like peptidase domain-containing protein [Verrucomicrobia bacterium]|nr:trypsin-like peptidase domain-containing protein [Verrucomicrobiota bacterium]
MRFFLVTILLNLCCQVQGLENLPQRSTLADLLKIQKTVQSQLPLVQGAVVAIQTNDGTASGVIITEDGLILTAAHVAEKPGRQMRVILQDGKRVIATTLGLDKSADAALMQLNDNDLKWPFVKVSREVVKTQAGQWCFALGHTGGFDKDRGVVLRVGKIVKQTTNALQSDCVLMGGDSGGPLFNLQGEVIGIHSQIWEERDQNMHVSMAPFFRSWDDLKSSQIIHTWSTGSGGYLGVLLDSEGDTEVLKVNQVTKRTAAELAGIQPGDIILRLDGETMLSVSQFQNAIRARAAGTQIQLQIQRAGEKIDLKVLLQRLPKEDAA